MKTRTLDLSTRLDVRPISADEWLPDRCLRLKDSFDPSAAEAQAGCERLQAFFTNGRRERLVSLYEDCLLRFGGCGFVAWEGDQVAGYNTFFPKDWSPTRRHPVADLRAPGTLHHHCISVVQSAQIGEDALASELLRRTFDWARENGWERFEVQAVFPTNLACQKVLAVYTQAFWEKLGLRVVAETDPLRRFEVIRSVALLDGVKVETREDADAYYADWRKDAVHYTMAIDF